MSKPEVRLLGRDLTASIVVFLVAMPLCMGIAIASGVPAEKGLITGIIGGIIVGALAGSPLQVSGPAAGLAVIVYELVRDQGLSALGPILVVAGAVQVAAGVFRLGGWFKAISPAVLPAVAKARSTTALEKRSNLFSSATASSPTDSSGARRSTS